MKNIFFICIAGLALLSSCQKDNSVYSDIQAEDSLPQVSLPHSIVSISNNAQNYDAVIESIYTGVNADAGGKFPILSGKSTKLVSTNLGTTRFLVIINKTGSNKSISIFDSDGVEYSKNISGVGHETLIFENIVVKENQPVSLQYNLSAVALPTPAKD
ncbi:MAG: hypothetical protein QM802_12160 [Agriterribacter sp.]